MEEKNILMKFKVLMIKYLKSQTVQPTVFQFYDWKLAREELLNYIAGAATRA